MTFVFKKLAVTAGMLFTISLPYNAVPAEASNSVTYDSSVVPVNSKNITVQWVVADLKDPFLRVMPVTAAEGIGHVESLASLAGRSDAAVAINGTFFDSYEADDSMRQPNGLMIESGGIVRSGANIALGVRTDKIALIHPLETKLKFNIKHNKNVYTVLPWGVNTYYDNHVEGQVVAYTRHFAEQIDKPGGTKVVIEGGRITNITEGSAAVPDYGYVIFVEHTWGNDHYLLPNLYVGDETKIETLVADGSSGTAEDPAQAWESAIGVGPKLVTNGQIDVDFARDGFNDTKITNGSSARSFVGVGGFGQLILGTTSSATIWDMAQALVQLGITDAMNMDGGGSSGLYFEGDMKRSPARLLSNALVVRRYDFPQVQVTVNGNFINEFRGFVKNDVTMVPFRGIFERIAADFKWNEAERKITAERESVELSLRPDVLEAVVNGKQVKLQQAPIIIGGHVYIPLRFVAETLGAKVGWDQSLYRATLELK